MDINEAKKALAITCREAEDMNVQHWVDFGTLLGIYRDRALIPWDNDVDVSCVLGPDERPPIPYRFKCSRSSKWPDGHPSGYDFRFRGVKVGLKVWRDMGDTLEYLSYDDKCILHVPKALALPTKPSTFNGHVIGMPRHTADYLQYLYGETWRTPDPDFKHDTNSHWWRRR